jgi:hypothetical protein
MKARLIDDQRSFASFRTTFTGWFLDTPMRDLLFDLAVAHLHPRIAPHIVTKFLA